MLSFGNERQVQQGEDWNLDILLSSSNEEYIPYIVSNQRINPYFVVTVASTKYEKNLRYVKSWWNSAVSQNLPLFYQTIPELYKEDLTSIASLPNAPSTVTTDPTYGDNEDDGRGGIACKRRLYYYTLKNEEINPDLGHKEYHYFYFDYTWDGVQWTNAQRVNEYECFLRQNFLSKDTQDWSSQNYLYQITLVSGPLLKDVLNDIYIAHGGEDKYPDWPKLPDNPDAPDYEYQLQIAIEKEYKYCKIQWPNVLQPDIDATSGVGYIQSPEPILPPTKLEVFNNLRTLI